MKVFIGIVNKDDDSAYGIHFPDAPGCYSAADDIDDLMANAQEALALYLEDAEDIEPRSLQEVAKDADVQEDIKNCAMLLAVPVISLAGVSKRANVTIDSFLLKDIDKTAKERGTTRSGYLAGLAMKDIYGAAKAGDNHSA